MSSREKRVAGVAGCSSAGSDITRSFPPATRLIVLQCGRYHDIHPLILPSCTDTSASCSISLVAKCCAIPIGMADSEHHAEGARSAASSDGGRWHGGEKGISSWGQALCPALDAILKWAELRLQA